MSLMVQIGEYKTTHKRIHIKILTRESLHSNLLFDALPLPHPYTQKSKKALFTALLFIPHIQKNLQLQKQS